MIIHSKKLLNTKAKNPVEIVGVFPGDFSDESYDLIKRGDYFYALANTGAKYDEKSTDIRKLNFIAKSTDLRNWIRSGIGSGCTRYDSKTDSFYSITLGCDYEVNEDNPQIAYHVTKINPDTFAYTNTTVARFQMSGNSRGISSVQRVKNSLIFLTYQNSHNAMVNYLYDSDSTWKSYKASSVNSFVASSYSIYLAGNGNICIAYGFLTSTAAYDTICFSAASTFGRDTNDYFTGRPTISGTTASNSTYDVDYSSNKFYYSTTLRDITHTINLPTKFAVTSIAPSCVVYDHYAFLAYQESVYNVSSIPDAFGKIRVIDLNNGYCYLFDYEYNLYYNSSSTTAYLRSVLGVFDDYLYFHSRAASSKGTIFRVPVEYVLSKMERFYGE